MCMRGHFYGLDNGKHTETKAVKAKFKDWSAVWPFTGGMYYYLLRGHPLATWTTPLYTLPLLYFQEVVFFKLAQNVLP